MDGDNSDDEAKRTPAVSRKSSEDHEDLSFIGKFKKAVEGHPKRLKEMNTWQPQGY